MEKLRIKVGDQIHEVDARAVNLICHDGTLNPEVEGTITIDPTATLAFTDSVTEELFTTLQSADYALFRILVDYVFKNKITFPSTVDELKRQGTGYKHVFGLIYLLTKAINTGQTPYVRLPETYLHPSAQAQLGDVFFHLQNPNEFIAGLLSK